MMSVDAAGNPSEHMLTIVRNAGYRLVACPLAGVRSSRLRPWEHDSNMPKPVFGLRCFVCGVSICKSWSD